MDGWARDFSRLFSRPNTTASRQCRSLKAGCLPPRSCCSSTNTPRGQASKFVDRIVRLLPSEGPAIVVNWSYGRVMRRPTMFLSSTVYDFHDLRSALKDYLELRGCTVYASDYNDFAKELEPHSYEACLHAIEQADLFVLFIGSRIGGLVDAATRKSITRAEYERAYELAQQGRIRIVSFVRNEVWTHRESVKEMERFLREDQERQRERPVTSAPTKFMTDPETTISFIELVARNAETAQAVKGEGAFPIANWLHTFSTFGEIRSVLDPLIFAGLDVPQAAGRAVLYHRLTTLLQGILVNTHSGPVMPVNRVRNLTEKIGLTFEKAKGKVDLDVETWTSLIGLVTFLMPTRADPAPLLAFLSDPLLLDYDPRSDAFRATPEHVALDDLTQAIVAFNLALAGFKFGEFVGNNNVNRPPMTVDGLALAGVLHLLLRWATMSDLALALGRAMSGKPFVRPEPMPRGPFVDQEAALDKEQLSVDIVRAFVERD